MKEQEESDLMAQSIWPRDTSVELQLPLKPVGELTCFVISPFQPKTRFDDLFDLVNGVCQEIRTALQLDTFSCIRSDTITSAGVIHPEIWQQIKQADIIVADVSGQNGNVMLELGVAAAWRNKEQVIILREEIQKRNICSTLTPHATSNTLEPRPDLNSSRTSCARRCSML
jgi:hypothetical protein